MRVQCEQNDQDLQAYSLDCSTPSLKTHYTLATTLGVCDKAHAKPDAGPNQPASGNLAKLPGSSIWALDF